MKIFHDFYRDEPEVSSVSLSRKKPVNTAIERDTVIKFKGDQVKLVIEINKVDLVASISISNAAIRMYLASKTNEELPNRPSFERVAQVELYINNTLMRRYPFHLKLNLKGIEPPGAETTVGIKGNPEEMFTFYEWMLNTINELEIGEEISVPIK